MTREHAPGLDPGTLAAFRAGDTDALAQVYDFYSGAVWSVAMSILRDAALAEDATQETFLRAWRGAASTDPARDLGPWLMTIARRTAIDVHRHESRPTLGGHTAEQDAPVVLPGIEGAWTTWQVRCALDALTPEERDVVRLAHYGAMTHSEIAAALQVPVGTVKSRAHRAHRRLAELLDHMIEESVAGVTR